MAKTKKIILILLIIIIPALSFGSTYSVSNLEDFKNAMVEDVKKQDTEIIINYYNNTGYDFYEGKNLAEKMFWDTYDNLYKKVEGKNIGKTRYYINVNNPSILTIRYLMTYKNSANDLQQTQKIINDFIKINIKEDMTDYEKVKTIYNFVLDKYEYGRVKGQGGNLKERNLLLGLQGKPVVCEAYAMLFSQMVSTLGYDNVIVSGFVDNNRHAWNMVKIDGDWYHVDATWGDFKGDGLEYFPISDKEIKKNGHKWDEDKYPSAPNQYDMHKEVKAKEIKEIKKYIKRLDKKSFQINTLLDFIYLKNEVYRNEIKVQNLKKQMQYLPYSAFYSNTDEEIREIEKKLEKVSKKIKEKESEFQIDVLIVNDNQFIPIGQIAKELKAHIKWNNEKRQVLLKHNDKDIILQIGEKQAFINGKAVELDFAPFIKDGRTFVSPSIITVFEF